MIDKPQISDERIREILRQLSIRIPWRAIRSAQGVLEPSQTISRVKKWFESLPWDEAKAYCENNDKILMIRKDYGKQIAKSKQEEGQGEHLDDIKDFLKNMTVTIENHRYEHFLVLDEETLFPYFLKHCPSIKKKYFNLRKKLIQVQNCIESLEDANDYANNYQTNTDYIREAIFSDETKMSGLSRSELISYLGKKGAEFLRAERELWKCIEASRLSHEYLRNKKMQMVFMIDLSQILTSVKSFTI